MSILKVILSTLQGKFCNKSGRYHNQPLGANFKRVVYSAQQSEFAQTTHEQLVLQNLTV